MISNLSRIIILCLCHLFVEMYFNFVVIKTVIQPSICSCVYLMKYIWSWNLFGHDHNTWQYYMTFLATGFLYKLKQNEISSDLLIFMKYPSEKVNLFLQWSDTLFQPMRAKAFSKIDTFGMLLSWFICSTWMSTCSPQVYPQVCFRSYMRITSACCVK